MARINRDYTVKPEPVEPENPKTATLSCTHSNGRYPKCVVDGLPAGVNFRNGRCIVTEEQYRALRDLPAFQAYWGRSIRRIQAGRPTPSTDKAKVINRATAGANETGFDQSQAEAMQDNADAASVTSEAKG